MIGREVPFLYPQEVHSASSEEEKADVDLELPDEELYRFLFDIDKKEFPDHFAVKYLMKALEELDQRERFVVTEFLKGETFAQIASGLERVKIGNNKKDGPLLENRVEQIYKKAVKNLRDKLKSWEKPSKGEVLERKVELENRDLPETQAADRRSRDARWKELLKAIDRKNRRKA